VDKFSDVFLCVPRLLGPSCTLLYLGPLCPYVDHISFCASGQGKSIANSDLLGENNQKFNQEDADPIPFAGSSGP